MNMGTKGRTGRPTGRPPVAQAQALSQNILASDDDKKIPTPPSHFDEDALRMWNAIFKMSHITESDYFAVKLCCEIYEEYEYARRLLKTGAANRITTHPNRVRGESPELKDLRTARVELNSAMAALGLTPTDRARLQVAEDASTLAVNLLMEHTAAKRKAAREGRGS